MRKRILLGSMLAVMVTFGIMIVGCVSTNEQWAMSAMYKQHTNEVSDIRGAMTIDSMLLWRSVRTNDNRILLVDRASRGDEVQWLFTVDLLMPRWLFVDTLMLSINGEDVITLVDNNPSRGTNGNGSVREIVNFMLSDEIVTDLKTATSLTLQFFGEPINIPQAGLDALQTFMVQFDTGT